MFKKIKSLFSLALNSDKVMEGFSTLEEKGFSWGDSGYTSQDLVQLDEFTLNLLFNQNYRTLAQEGFMQNAIAYHCIDKITSCAKNIPVKVLVDGEERDTNFSRMLEKNLRQPNPDQNGCQFLVASMSYSMIKGEYYIWSDLGIGEIISSETYRPDRVSKTNMLDDKIQSFQVTTGGKTLSFYRDEEGYFDLLYWKTFNPLSDINGLSPLSAGGMSIDQYNEANKWNKNLFENGTKLSGIMNLALDKNGMGGSTNISVDKLRELSKFVNETLSKRKGGTAVLNFPANYTPIGMGPTDMDFIQAQKSKAMEICNVLGYPPYLLGIEGATFNNQESAQEALYESSVIPRTKEFYDYYGDYHSRLFNTDIEYKIQIDNIPALAQKRERIKKTAREDFKAGIINQNEARIAGGREPIPGGDQLFVNPNPRGMIADGS
jgi:HK97 family phage portal protein